jgi:hypothetical protein
VLLVSAVQGGKTGAAYEEPYTTEDLRGLTPPVKALTINDIRLFVDRNASFAQLAGAGVAVDYPKGTGHLIWAEGIFWGGLVEDGQTPRLRVNGSHREITGLKAGKVLLTSSGQVIGSDDPETRHVWRVRKDYQQRYSENNPYYLGDEQSMAYDAAFSFEMDLEDVDQSDLRTLYEQYDYDWQNWPADEGAPFDDIDEDGHYDPDVDIPGYPGADQTIWLVANDIPITVDGDTVDISRRLYRSPGIGLELQMTIWGYEKGPMPYLENALFKQVRLIYTGNYESADTAHIDTMFISQWSDPDLGTYTDDYVGCDIETSLGFVYNSNPIDRFFLENFGLPVPAGGYAILQGPVANGETLGMSSFGYIGAPTPYEPTLRSYDGTIEWWNLMNGFLPTPHLPYRRYWTDPHTGEATKFALSGDPVTGEGWIDGIVYAPGDRVIFMSAGPFSMALGDTQEVVIALIGGMGYDALSSLSVLRHYNRVVRLYYELGFKDLSKSFQPTVVGFGGDGQVVLDWGSDLEVVATGERGTWTSLEFEGYNVYQLPNPESALDEAVRIATFDRINEITTIIETRLDEKSRALAEAVVQIGTNSGIQRHLQIAWDVIRDRPISNDRSYHYAVTSYSLIRESQGLPVRMVESPPRIITVIPQQPAPGEVYSADYGDTMQVVHVSGPATGRVRVQVINPDEIIDADWEVHFKYFDPVTGEQVAAITAGDTLADGSAAYFLGWNLVRDGLELLTNMTPIYAADERTGTAPILFGMQIIVQDAASESGDVQISTEDQFTWSSASKVTDDREAALEMLDKINVYPNPYLGRHAIQANRHDRWMRFTHLPQRATIRIFNLGGTMIRILEKDDPSSQYLTWDLTSQGRFLVASGIYIAHIELPDYGQTKILKLGVVQQEVILDIY